MYKGQISKSGIAILPSKRTRKIPDIKKIETAEPQIEVAADKADESLDQEPLTLKEEVEVKK